MARARKRKPWENAFRQVRGVNWPDRIYPPRTTIADLDAAEAELGVRLPASYRAFAEAFGLGGWLVGIVVIPPLTRPSWRAPEPNGWPLSVLEWARCDKARMIGPFDIEPNGDRQRPRRLIVFAEDSGYHTFAFDPLEITDTDHQEYRIYDVTRDRRLHADAESFHEWLVQTSRRYFQKDEEEEALWAELCERPEPPVFKPDSHERIPAQYERTATPRRKIAPDEASVRLWLGWNHGVIAGLVRSIRDGQTDAFAVLADALEEAGCDNADLLDSCRKGDPDIDGVWVMRVLSP
jgi:hypothetical protein